MSINQPGGSRYFAPDAPLRWNGPHLQLNAATAALPGSMSAADKAKLDAYPAFGATPAFRVFHAVAQSIPNNAATSVAFTSAAYNTHGGYASNAYTVPVGWGGVWTLGTTGLWAANATGRRFWQLTKGGSALTGFDTPQRVVGDYLLVAGDVLTVQGLQASGGALNLSAPAGAYAPAFWGHWVRA